MPAGLGCLLIPIHHYPYFFHRKEERHHLENRSFQDKPAYNADLKNSRKVQNKKDPFPVRQTAGGRQRMRIVQGQTQ